MKGAAQSRGCALVEGKIRLSFKNVSYFLTYLKSQIYLTLNLQKISRCHTKRSTNIGCMQLVIPSHRTLE